MQSAAAEPIPTEIYDPIHNNAGTKADPERSEAALRADLEHIEAALRADLQRIEASLKNDMSAMELGLGSITKSRGSRRVRGSHRDIAGFSALHLWPPHP
jgi:hypothetical protein